MATTPRLGRAISEYQMQALERTANMTPEQRTAQEFDAFKSSKAAQAARLDAMDANKYKFQNPASEDAFRREKTARGPQTVNGMSQEEFLNVVRNQKSLVGDSTSREAEMQAIERSARKPFQPSAQINYQTKGTAERKALSLA